MEDYFRHDWSDGRARRGRAGRAAPPGMDLVRNQRAHRLAAGLGRRPDALRGGGGQGPRALAEPDGGRRFDDCGGGDCGRRERWVRHGPRPSRATVSSRAWAGRGPGCTPSTRSAGMRPWPGFPSPPGGCPTASAWRSSLDGPQTQLTYRVHLYQDWIESIVFSKERETIGEWTFSYPKPDEADPHRLNAPSPSHGSRGRTSASDGLWLMRLAEGPQHQ